MATGPKLDAARRSAACQLILTLCAIATLATHSFAQQSPGDATRLAAAQTALDSGRWQEAATLAAGPAGQSAEFDLIAGLALAHLQHWTEARASLDRGRLKAPADARFPVELAGIAYKTKDVSAAKRDLHAALRLRATDAYAQEFLGTLYFLDGNIEAALKYWNPLEKPRLASVSIAPPPHLAPALVNRIVQFNAPQVLSVRSLLATTARLDNLEVFPRSRLELVPTPTGNYEATVHAALRAGWMDSPIENAVSLFSGLPYSTVYPEFYNLGHRAINFTSLARWDSEKRRIYASLTTPLLDNPALRLRFFSDVRNENWNLSTTYFGGTPLTDVNVRRATGGLELHEVENGLWSWSAGLAFTSRSFRNLPAVPSANSQPFFTNGNSLSVWLRAERPVLRVPEHRFRLDAEGELRPGRNFADGMGAFTTLRGSLQAHWLPRAKGDDYEMHAQLRGGLTMGKQTLDDLFQLGIERDNDLWLRGHSGTIDGRKGAAPLGRRYFLSSWEMDKNVYEGAFFVVKVGPFLDSGATADSSALFGSQRWLWDTGAQCKIRILGTVTVLLSYGRDLRGGKNTFYSSALH
ncbi:MAG TPA: hypothetical protein VK525_11160 [Candidatus Saccharimonadales bacterium]|nr:hypothetical protein [Candidatus Saccharimonadales bacterium]